MINIGKLGIWFSHNPMSIAESIAFAQQVEACGYGALWIPEAIGREPLVHLAYLSSKTSSLVLATGIANIWARDAVTMAAAQKTLVELSGNRFLLGLGVSHAPLVEGVRGHRYHRPLSYMRDYLDKMASAIYDSPAPAEQPPIVLAALRQKMLMLARDKADGAHPYFVPPAHTRSGARDPRTGEAVSPSASSDLGG